MGAHTYNPSICEAEEEEKKLEVNVGCVVASKSSQDAQEEPGAPRGVLPSASQTATGCLR